MRDWPVQCSRKRYEVLVKHLASEARIDPRPILDGDKTSHFRAIRWKAWRILRDAGCSYLQIGKASGFDHTAVIYALSLTAREKRRERYRARCEWIVSGRGPYRTLPAEVA